MDSAHMTTEMEALKSKLRATWSAGDFGYIAWTYDNGAREFVERLNLGRGVRVLDVACGTGNLSIPAARTGAEVTGIDIVPALIEQSIQRNGIEALGAEFDIGDAEAMPYPDQYFDALMTMFGAMFTPRPKVMAAEMRRVCRHGGHIAMANWTQEGFIGQMFNITGQHVKPPVGMPSPLLWGNEDVVRERLNEGIYDLQTTRREISFALPSSPVETVEHFRLYYGPTQKAFDTLDNAGKQALRSDLEQLWSDHNQATDGTTLVRSEYLEVRAITE